MTTVVEERKGCDCVATKKEKVNGDTIRFRGIFFVLDVPRAEKSSENSVVLEVSLSTYSTGVRLQRVDRLTVY